MGNRRGGIIQTGPFKMNYQESRLILEKIKKAKKILINCHRSPDADSVGSATALYQALLNFGKQPRIICVDETPSDLRFLPYADKVERVDFTKFPFEAYDLFIAPDSSSWDTISDNKKIVLPKIAFVTIDHHKTNTGYGEINLVDSKISSTAELLFLVFDDWGVTVNENISMSLLTGIIGDTGAFQYPGVTEQTLKIAGELIKKGASKNKVILNLFRSKEFRMLKFWGEMLNLLKIDEENKFVWVAVPYVTYIKYRGLKGRDTFASLFAPIVQGTDFGMIMVEEEKNTLFISLRGRTNFDTSRIATSLGGGGHPGSSGARVESLPFDKAVEKVLETARLYSRK